MISVAGMPLGTAVFLLQMQKSATSYQVRSGLSNDAGVWTVSSWYDISNDWNAFEIDYQSLLYDGNMTLWLNDVLKQTLWLIDNDTRTVTEVRLGAQGIETGTRGTVYFDDFESRRFSYIGTLPDPGVNDPQATNSAAWLAYTYHYTGIQPHAVTSMEIEGGSTNSYEYDLNGNTLASHCVRCSAMQCRCDLPRGERRDLEAKLQRREPHLCHPQDERKLFHRHCS